jgi:hypothetical protein
MFSYGDLGFVCVLFVRDELIELRYCGLYLLDADILKDLGVGNGSVLWMENRMFRTSYHPVVIHIHNRTGEVIDFHIFPGENVFQVKQRIAKVSGYQSIHELLCPLHIAL